MIYAIPFSNQRLRVFFDHEVRSVDAKASFWRLEVGEETYEPISVKVEGVNAVELEFGSGVPTNSGKVVFTGDANTRGV